MSASIQLTGRIRVVGPAGVLDAGELPGRQARLVLASLAVTDHPVPREVLALRLWGDPLPRAWQRDLPVVMAVIMLSAVVFVVVHLLVELAYPLLDPRLRRGVKTR